MSGQLRLPGSFVEMPADMAFNRTIYQFRIASMFKSAASVSSLAYNFLLSFLLLFAYNGIFLQKLYAVTGSGWDFVSVNLIVFLLSLIHI